MKKYWIASSMIALFLIFALFPLKAESQPMKRQLPRMALKGYLNLTPEQEAKLEEFRKARLEGRKAFQEKMRQMREEISGLLKDPKADRKKIDSLIDEIAKLRASQWKEAIRHREEVNKIFTPEQQEKLKKFREKMITRRFMDRGFFGERQFRQGRFWGPQRFPGFGWRGGRFPHRMWHWW